MTNPNVIASLVERLKNLSILQLSEIERHVIDMEISNCEPMHSLCQPTFDWPHAPVHRLDEKGVYIVTAGTLYKHPFFNNAAKLDLLQSTILQLANELQWHLEAWACFPNHYHLIARAEQSSYRLETLLMQIHSQTAIELNKIDRSSGRAVWFNYFDTRLTFHNSYMARLNYVHQNAVRHKLVRVANQYPWCSAAWFERTASPSQVRTVYSYRTDQVKIQDDFDQWPEGFPLR